LETWLPLLNYPGIGENEFRDFRKNAWHIVQRICAAVDVAMEVAPVFEPADATLTPTLGLAGPSVAAKSESKASSVY
jgi:hypothetical protein